ncbi:hypothetical protein AAFF_G00323920 [Aldrovandia affinis]|uniref:Uncharacterized protein n=1 Tax=Aldrovandia affinis TaxID=143900 RepID=A0AAD7R7F2_9TELE|nr:hypothetical protein AAFF_G00323920 [Aldrovandia affinis]
MSKKRGPGDLRIVLVPELLQKIDKMVEENGGCCYTNEMSRIDEQEGEMTCINIPSKQYPDVSPAGVPPKRLRHTQVPRKPGLLDCWTVGLRIVLSKRLSLLEHLSAVFSLEKKLIQVDKGRTKSTEPVNTPS